MTTAGLPPIDLSERGDQLPSAARHTLVVGVLSAHLVAGWALMQVDAVRDAVKEAAPLFVDLLAPPAPPPPPPPPAPVLRKPTPRPPPVIATPPAPTPDPTPSFVVPAPEPPPPVAAAPEPPPAPPAPPAPPPPPPEPKVIPATAVRYVAPPAPVYPAQSQRMKEQGRVLLRVEIGADGRARQVLVSRSSGHARLDESAASAVRQARFAPYTENGVALVVWTNVPIDFELIP
jgi:protein TonB